MEKLSEREHVLLGYTHRDPFGILPDPRHRNSDVDFHDVFGGPPRRFSLKESRRSRVDSLDSYSSRGRSESGEKPVFGEMSSPARRTHLGDNFFSDIFQSSDSSCSTPRKADRDLFPSTPGSRVLSPIRSVRCESVTGGSSLPAQLSLSMKLAKVVDQPAFSSPTHRALSKNEDGSLDAFSFPSSPNATVTSFTTRAVPAQDDLRNDGHALYHRSPLSRQLSHSLGRSLEASDSASLSIESQSRKDPTSLESYIRNGQFHFSIYKWAGKGVTLIMPSKSNEIDKYDNRLIRLPEIVLQVSDLHPPDNEDMSNVTKGSKSQSENLDSKKLKRLDIEGKDDADSKIVEDLSPAEFQSEFLHSDVTIGSGTCNDNSEEVLATMHEMQKHELKNVSQLFDDDLDKQRNEDIIRQVEETESLFRDQKSVYDDTIIKQQAERENKMNRVEVISPIMRDAPVPLEDKMRGSKVKGKVKEFIKIFNLEVLPKRKGTFETLDRRSKGRDGGKSKVEDRVSAPAAKAEEKTKTTSRNNNRTLLDIPIPINQDLEKAVKANSNISYVHMIDDFSNMSYDIHMIDNSLSEGNDTLETCSESTPQIFEASVCNIEESNCEDLEGCLVLQLSQDQNKNLQTDSHQDQIKVSDAKIWEWSKGKEGHIRSLLSTLQYVLWPESGWKPVPLVDIIEATSVKRAYQKALLCLHPDKLQQKGAAMHRQYIAEKVFEILQEAWDHFNSVTQF